MITPVPEITLAECRERIGAVARRARELDVDAIMAWSRGGNTLERHGAVLWLTSFYNPWLAVTDSRHWQGQSWCAALVTRRAELMLVTNIPHSAWADHAVACDAFTNNPSIVASAGEAVNRLGLSEGRIALDGADTLSAALWEGVQEQLPQVRWSRAEGLVAALAEVKSPAEQALMRRGGEIADAQMTAILEAMTAGGSELEAIAAGAQVGARAGAISYGTFLANGSREARLSPPSPGRQDDRPLTAGELWRVDVIGAYHGYLFDFARSTVVGSPDVQQREVLEAPIAVVEAIIAAIEPGRPVADAFQVGARRMAEVAPWASAPTIHDFPHFGHTLGAGWGSWWLTEDERRPFTVGTVWAVEAAISHPSVGAPMFEQNIIVGESRVELLTRCPTRPWNQEPVPSVVDAD